MTQLPPTRYTPQAMKKEHRITTSRLILRSWRPEDREPYAAMCADPVVMEYFMRPLLRDESFAEADRIDAVEQKLGFCFWAVEVPGVAPFVGFVGLSSPSFTAPFTPCFEIGWRLARPHWGSGYATEGARAALEHGFTKLNAPEIVAFTVPPNQRSRHVMEKIGMHRDPADDFDHPRIPEGHHYQRHVLYRLSRSEWEKR